MSDIPTPKVDSRAVDGQAAGGKNQPAPASLTELLSTARASAKSFVRHIKSRPSLSEADLSHALQMVREQPSTLKRVVDLARAVTDAAPQPVTLLRWLEEVVRSQDDELRDWGCDPTKNAVVTLRELAVWARRRVPEKGHATRRQEAERCLLIGLNVLLAGRALTPLDALQAFETTTNKRKPGGRAPSPDQAARGLVVRAGIKQLLDLARIAALYDAKVTCIEEAQHRAILQVGRLSREKEVLEASHQVQQAKIEDLEHQLAERDEQLSELAADIEAARTRGLQDASRLKSRFRRQIGEGLSGLLADAWDALDTDPPHPNVARERLEHAREALRRELEWLNKSSD